MLIAKKLVSNRGIRINEQDAVGTTLLHIAAMRGYLDILKLLLAINDIKINLADYDGKVKNIFYKNKNFKTNLFFYFVLIM